MHGFSAYGLLCNIELNSSSEESCRVMHSESLGVW